MAKPKLKVGGCYNTKDKRKVTLVEDHGEYVMRQVDGEPPQPMRRELFEDWITSVSRAKA